MTAGLHDPDGLTIDFKPRLHESVVMVEVDNEAVLYDESSGQLHQLDPVGTVVCSLFDGQTTIRALADDLAEVFGAARETVERDVLEMVRQLGRVGAIAGIAARDQPAVQDVDGGR